jgi:phosphate transport system substrate-binding protein
MVGDAVPSAESVTAGKYPIFVIVYLFTKGEPAGIAKEYIDFILSPDGQKVVRDAGMIPVK